MNWLHTHPEITFYLLTAVALLLARIPVLGKYFRSVNTMIHEGGHALVTLLLSGEVLAVNLFADTSGTTVTKSKSKFSNFLIALSGYPASSLVGWLCLLLLSKGFDLYVLFMLTSIALVMMVLSIRNTYGLFWTATFVVISLLLIYFDNKFAIRLASVFFSLIILTDSVLSALVLLVISWKQPKKAGDAANLQKITRINAVVWALLILAFAVFVAWICVVRYFPPVTFLQQFLS